MANSNEHFITAIDVGSAKTCVLVAEITDSGLRYRSHGITDSLGSRKGAIVELEKAITSIQRAVEQAEDGLGAPIERAVVGVSGALVRGINSTGGITLGSRPHEVTRDEIRTAVEKARAISMPADRQVLHLLPQEFILDHQPGVRDPTGMIGSKLGVRVHVVTTAANTTQNVITAVNRAGIQVQDTIFEPLACADAVLRPEERDLGVCLVDIGAGSSDVIAFQESAVTHTAVIPVGGDHFTSDISVGLRTPLAEAERLKRSFGCAVVTRIPEGHEIEVPSVGDRPSRMLPQRVLGEILEPRARELFEMVRDNLRHAGMLEAAGAGVVLTGGGSRMSGILEIADAILRKPVRLGWPTPLSKMPALLAEPEFTTAIGLVFYGHRARLVRGSQDQRWGVAKLKALFSRVGA
jgi:cell division protein FtsA